jgi:hypothetical protein
VSLILRFMGRPKLGRSGVNDADYHVPFRFTGTINKLTVKPGPEQFTEDPPIRAPTVYPGPAKAARRPTQRCLSASGNGMAGSFGSTRRSIRASVSRASTGRPDFRAHRPTSWARTIRTRAYSAISSRRRSI